MADSKQNPSDKHDRSLSEISHLFLSSVRDRHTGGAARPQRTPPGAKQRPQTPVDLSAEEFSRILDGAGPQDSVSASPHRSDDTPPTQLPPVTAVIASHLNGEQRRRVREYAAHLCKSGERVGLIELDAGELRLSCFELGSGSASHDENGNCDSFDGRRMSEALEEMSWDVDRWLLNLPNPRLPEARALLQSIRNWTVLATCDHDGVVACYRSMKGLADLHEHELTGGHQDESPTLSLALLDSHDEMQSMRVFRKLANVCRQFLHWPLESEAPVVAAGSVVEHQVLDCKSREKTPIGSPPSCSPAPQWQIVSDFVARAKRSAVATSRPAAVQPSKIESKQDSAATMPVASGVAISSGPALEVQDRQPSFAPSVAEDEGSDVIDLPAGADSAAAIVSATLRGDSSLVELPVKAPMLDDASLAVARDRRLVLLAVARQGLSDLRAIGEAWRWMNENRALIAMAVPQLSIDPHQLPHLRLLIDRADLSADVLQPLMQSGNVIVRTYRKLRWGAKAGLLLEAA